MSLFIRAFFLVFNSYTLTYFTKGPAKIPLDQFEILQTLFYVFFTGSRILSAFISHKMNPLVFFFFLLLTCLSVSILFVLPFFNSMQGFYWFFVCASGLTVGPLYPSLFVVAKYMLRSLNSFQICILCISDVLGELLAVQVTSILLDYFHPSEHWLQYNNATSVYVIPLILLFLNMALFSIYILSILLYKRFKSVLDLENIQ